MKNLRNFIILIGIISNLTLQAQQKNTVEVNYVDTIHSKFETILEAKEKGVSISFYDSYKVDVICHKLNGSFINAFLKYYPSGDVMIAGSFDSLPSDTITVYYDCIVSSDGIYEKTCSYEKIKGVKVGEWRYYFENGILQAKGNFVDGLKTGEWQYFDMNKNLILIEIWENGTFQKTRLIDK